MAVPPPPDPRDEATKAAIGYVQFLLGSWGASNQNRRSLDHLRVAADWQWNTFYIEDNYRKRILVLSFDAVSGKYKLFAPMAGGFEVVDVSCPDAKTVTWITHPDGPAIRSTITDLGGRLRKVDTLLDADGSVKPELEVIFDRMGTANIGFTSPKTP